MKQLVMSHYKCSVSGCQRYAVLKQPYCPYCDKYHCFDHIEDADSHPCYGMEPAPPPPHWGYKEEYGPLVDKLDLSAIVAQAESLRPGHTCKGPDQLVIGERGYTSFIKGGTHMHFAIEFDDGKKWMVRAKKISQVSPPLEVDKAQIFSEAATFKRLHEAGVKVPQVWLPSEWPLYYFVEYVEGAYHPAMNGVEPEEPDEMLKAIIRDLADFFISLEAVSYSSVGSLTFGHDGGIEVGPVIGMDEFNTERPFHLGPFRSTKERYAAEIDHLLRLIAQDEYCAPSRSLPRYLALLEARSLVQECTEMDEGPTYICHGEPKGDHVLVNDRGSITAVIDWDWSYLSCKAEAFAAPWALLSDGYFLNDNALSPREIYLRDTYLELGRPDLARFVEGTRKWMRLGNVLTGVSEFRELIATRKAFELGREVMNYPETEEEWRHSVVTRFADDKVLQKLLVKYS